MQGRHHKSGVSAAFQRTVAAIYYLSGRIIIECLLQNLSSKNQLPQATALNVGILNLGLIGTVTKIATKYHVSIAQCC